MLDTTTISKLQAVLGITNLAELIAAEEAHIIEVPMLFSEAQKNTFGRNRFEDGTKAFGEIWTKDMKVKYPNVKYEGKNAEQFMNKFADIKVLENGEEPDKKILKYKTENEELKTKLQSTLDNVNEIKDTYESKIFGLSVNNSVAQLIPENTIIPRNQVMTIFNSEIVTRKDEDGKVYHMRGSEVLKDEVGNYKTTQQIVAEFIDSNKFVKTGGMNGSDAGGQSGSTYKSMSSFMDGMEKKGIEPMSPEGQKILLESKKDANFDLNS